MKTARILRSHGPWPDAAAVRDCKHYLIPRTGAAQYSGASHTKLLCVLCPTGRSMLRLLRYVALPAGGPSSADADGGANGESEVYFPSLHVRAPFDDS